MVVHICNTEGVNSQIIKDTVEFLSTFNGLIKFQSSKSILDEVLANALDVEGVIETFGYYDFPNIAKLYRYKHDIDKNDILVIVSNHKLDYEYLDESKRWFSYFSNNDIVIRSYGWENYTNDKIHLAISHQIAENIFQIKSGLTLKTRASTSLYHFDSNQVCINNFVIFEDDIKIKLYSGYICQECSENFLSKNSTTEFYEQIENIIEGVRKSLKPILIAKNNIEKIEIFEDGQILIGDADYFKITSKRLNYIYLFFLVNNGKHFTKHDLFNKPYYLESLARCYNILNKKSYEKPDLNNLPKVIQTHISTRLSNISTFNSYRNEINDLIPKPYNIITTPNGGITYKYGIDLPVDKIKLPDKFLGFSC